MGGAMGGALMWRPSRSGRRPSHDRGRPALEAPIVAASRRCAKGLDYGEAAGWVSRFLALLVDPGRKQVGGPMNDHVASGPDQATISKTAVRLLSEYTGRGPTKAKTTIGEDLVTIVLGDTLTKGERKLVDAGHEQRVLELRHDYQRVMSNDLISAVEDTLDREVVAFMSNNHIDPDLAVEVFVLRPE